MPKNNPAKRKFVWRVKSSTDYLKMLSGLSSRQKLTLEQRDTMRFAVSLFVGAKNRRPVDREELLSFIKNEFGR